MAAGDTLVVFMPYNDQPPASAYATLDTWNNHPVLDFDKDATEQAVFAAVMPRQYAGGGVTVYIHWGADGLTTGDVRWDVAFELVSSEGQDIDSDGFAAVNSVTDTAPGTDGYITICSIAFTNGADMDSVIAGKGFRLLVQRDHDHADDDAAADAQLWAIELRETP